MTTAGRKKSRHSSALLALAYIYVFLPILLFLVGWLKLYIGIPLAALLLYFAFRAWKTETPIRLFSGKKKAELIVLIAAVAAIVIFWVVTSGIGEVVWQWGDHKVRNGIFETLIGNRWPVTNTLEYHGAMRERGLVYYLGFLLPAALIGKIATYPAGLAALVLWSALGIFLVWVFTCEKQGRLKLWYLVLLIFFGGLGIFGYFLTGGSIDQVGLRYEYWSGLFTYSSSMTLLAVAYNQAIPAWLLYLLIMRQRDNRNLILIWSAALLLCTFPAVGMIPFAVVRALQNAKGETAPEKLGDAIRSALTLPNLLGVGIAFVSTAYLFSNRVAGTMAAYAPVAESGQSVENTVANTGGGAAATAGSGFAGHLWLYLLFILIEVGIYFFLIYKAKRRDPLFWVSLAVLLIFPWIRVGAGKDFAMRATIPALFCLCLLIASAITQYHEKKKYALLGVLLAALVVGGITSIDVLRPPIQKTLEGMLSGQGVEIERYGEDVLLTSNYYSGDAEDSLFFKYLAR